MWAAVTAVTLTSEKHIIHRSTTFYITREYQTRGVHYNGILYWKLCGKRAIFKAGITLLIN